MTINNSPERYTLPARDPLPHSSIDCGDNLFGKPVKESIPSQRTPEDEIVIAYLDGKLPHDKAIALLDEALQRRSQAAADSIPPED